MAGKGGLVIVMVLDFILASLLRVILLMSASLADCLFSEARNIPLTRASTSVVFCVAVSHLLVQQLQDVAAFCPTLPASVKAFWLTLPAVVKALLVTLSELVKATLVTMSVLVKASLLTLSVLLKVTLLICWFGAMLDVVSLARPH